jgi:hypothetical protein
MHVMFGKPYPREWQPLLTLTRLAVDVAVTGRIISDFVAFTPSEMLVEMHQWGANNSTRS